uniref:Uncharacterized protein n=1 Tax=Setaria digitata TaxID=48799 RepID=A0A915PG41_9BILA
MNHKLDSMQNHCASPSEAAHCSNNQLQIPKQERGNRVLNLSEPKIPPQTFLSVYASDDEQMLEKLDQFKNEILNDIIRRGVYTDSVIQDCISKHVLENSTLTMVNLQQAINELLIDIGFSNDQINKTMLITNSETTATREELFSYEDKEFGSDEGECLSVIPSESDSEELEKEDDSITSNFESESSTDSLATLNNSSVADTINLSAPRIISRFHPKLMSTPSPSLIFIIFIDLVNIVYCDYFPLKNIESGEFGLRDQYGIPCLLLKFSAQLYNFNLNGTNIATEIPELTSSKVKLSGHCANNSTNNNRAQLRASWKKEGRRKQLDMSFGTAYVKDPINNLEELRWQLQAVSYSESYFKQSVEFSSDKVMISAPLKQKFICRDKLNLTLTNKHFKDCILELNPEISAQPYRIVGRYPSLFICERTRRRTLAESFESRMTIFSGVVLCVTSVSLMVGYTFRRQSHPTRRKLYESFS